MKQKHKTSATFADPFIMARRNKNGVLCVSASVCHRVGLLHACIYLLLGLTLTTFALIFVCESFANHKIRGTALLLFVEGFTFLLLGMRTLWLWRKLHRLTPTSILCERFGLNVEQLKRIADENGILPNAVVGGQDYFRVSDFGDITSLLRASAQPAPAEDMLLRPAASVEQETGEQLLRAKA